MSINRITYLDQFYNTGIFSISDPYIQLFLFNDYIEVTRFLKTLETGKAYVVSLEFIPSWLDGDDDEPVITLSKPILITKNSSARLISNFIKNKINQTCNNFYLDEDLLKSDNNGPGVLVKYKEINLF